MFEGLHSQGQQSEVRDWVLLSLGSFIQRLVICLSAIVCGVYLFIYFSIADYFVFALRGISKLW